jgi:hypothetical protein
LCRRRTPKVPPPPCGCSRVDRGEEAPRAARGAAPLAHIRTRRPREAPVPHGQPRAQEVGTGAGSAKGRGRGWPLYPFPPPPLLCSVELEWLIARSIPPVSAFGPSSSATSSATAEGPSTSSDPRRKSLWASILPARHRSGTGGDAELGSSGGAGGGRRRANTAGTGPALVSRICGGALHGGVWAAKVWVAPYAYLVCWAVAEAMSILLLWSEATIFLNLLGWVRVGRRVCVCVKGVQRAVLHDPCPCSCPAGCRLAAHTTSPSSAFSSERLTRGRRRPTSTYRQGGGGGGVHGDSPCNRHACRPLPAPVTPCPAAAAGRRCHSPRVHGADVDIRPLPGAEGRIEASSLVRPLPGARGR